MRKIVAVLGYGIKNPTSAFTYPADVINAGYATSLMKAGALPFLIPSTLSKDTITETVKAVDGILIPGGNDIDPSFYNEVAKEYTKDFNRNNDLFQFMMIEEALAQKKPIMGICRGLQVLNVFFNGSLYQDVEKEKEKSIRHKCYESPEGVSHEVEIKKNSLLHDAVKKERLSVNSLHHQGIRELGEDLEAVAFSPDGLIEGIENREKGILAVQWHPEALVMAEDEDALKIFRLFVSMMER